MIYICTSEPPRAVFVMSSESLEEDRDRIRCKRLPPDSLVDGQTVPEFCSFLSTDPPETDSGPSDSGAPVQALEESAVAGPCISDSVSDNPDDCSNLISEFSVLRSRFPS